jgi:hypothetical protein
MTSKPVEDYLDEDNEIPGQRFVLLSFISPEKVLDKKELFFFEKFMRTYEIEWKVKQLEEYLVGVVKHVNTQLDEKMQELEKKDLYESAEVCRKNRLNIESVITNYTEFVKKSKAELNKSTIKDSYDEFMLANKETLEKEFYKMNKFQTSIRGLKVRGVFDSHEEADVRAKRLTTKDKIHNILIGHVGKWLPWDPHPDEVKEQNYGNEELNKLMKKYKENETNREKFFEERKASSKPAKSEKPSEPEEEDEKKTEFNMFEATGDLAMQRKMEKP